MGSTEGAYRRVVGARRGRSSGSSGRASSAIPSSSTASPRPPRRASNASGRRPAQAGPNGAQIADRARTAFTDAMGTGFLAAAIVSAVGVALVVAFLPAHGVDAGESFDDEPAREATPVGDRVAS